MHLPWQSRPHSSASDQRAACVKANQSGGSGLGYATDYGYGDGYGFEHGRPIASG